MARGRMHLLQTHRTPLTYTLALANPTQPIPTPASLQSHLQKSVGLQWFFLKVLIRAVVEAAEIQMGALYGETTQLTLLSSRNVFCMPFNVSVLIFEGDSFVNKMKSGYA